MFSNRAMVASRRCWRLLSGDTLSLLQDIFLMDAFLCDFDLCSLSALTICCGECGWCGGASAGSVLTGSPSASSSTSDHSLSDLKQLLHNPDVTPHIMWESFFTENIDSLIYARLPLVLFSSTSTPYKELWWAIFLYMNRNEYLTVLPLLYNLSTKSCTEL
jgi:hypothetical protein